MQLSKVQNTLYGTAALGTVAAVGTVGGLAKAVIENTELAKNPAALLKTDLLCGRANQVVACFALASVLIIAGCLIVDGYNHFKTPAPMTLAEAQTAAATAATNVTNADTKVATTKTAKEEAKKALTEHEKDEVQALFKAVEEKATDAVKNIEANTTAAPLYKAFVEAEKAHAEAVKAQTEAVTAKTAADKKVTELTSATATAA